MPGKHWVMQLFPNKEIEMRFTFDKELIIDIIRIITGIIFIVAGVMKILNPGQFADAIDNYRMLPYILVTLMAIILPWLELVSGILLIVGPFKKGAAFVLLVLTLIFLIAISTAMLRGLDINCGCFSIENSATKVGLPKLIEDIVLLGALLIVYRKLPSSVKIFKS